MSQFETWEREYQNPRLVATTNEPQLDFKHFVKWLRKDQKVNLEGLQVLDLGSGTGKHSIFLAERGSIVHGIEISDTALRIAREKTTAAKLQINYMKGDMGKPWPFPDQSFDLILDILSSNSLNELELQVYIKELIRVLKPGGYIFIRALCKDGDKNAENLLLKFPGQEKNTYTMPGTGIVERVFSKDDIESLYSRFAVRHLVRKSSYTMFQGKSYKRNFWLLYLNKPANKAGFSP